MRRVYLDYNATTPVAPEVLEAMLPFFAGDYGNASSIHAFGQKCRAAVEGARDSVAKLLGARASEIVFTSGGTEADNLAIFGAVSAAPCRQAARPAKRREARGDDDGGARGGEEPVRGVGAARREVTYVPVNREGRVCPEKIAGAIRPETVLISVMLANNELGTLEPVERIAQFAAEKKILLHTDAVQAAGKIALDVNRIGAHLLSISAHKIYGPKGVGALYVREGTQLDPLLFGGHGGRKTAGREPKTCPASWAWARPRISRECSSRKGRRESRRCATVSSAGCSRRSRSCASTAAARRALRTHPIFFSLTSKRRRW